MLRRFAAPSAFAASATPSGVPVRPAATVMVVRDGADGVEVFVFRRVAAMAFAAGMLVFPGGRVDPADADELPWAGPSPDELAPLLGTPDAAGARALVAAAVRETFEEAHVLLASRPGGAPVDVSDASWDGVREDLVARRTTLSAVLDRAGGVLRADWLLPWAHWVTPAWEPRRYDTRFFLAALPGGQQPRDLGGEGEQARWVTAARLVAEHDSGTAAMFPPTRVTLEELAAAPDVAALQATVRRLRPVMPWQEAGHLVVDLDGVGGGEPGPGLREGL